MRKMVKITLLVILTVVLISAVFYFYQQNSYEDCGNDQRCLQEKLSTCSRAKGSVRQSLGGSDYVVNYYEIRGETLVSAEIGQLRHCVVYKKRTADTEDTLRVGWEANCQLPKWEWGNSINVIDLCEYCSGSWTEKINC